MLRWRQTSGTTHRMTLNTITTSISDITPHTLWYQTSGIRQPTSDNTHHGVDWHHTPSIAVWCDIRYHTLWCRLVSVWTDTRQYTSRCRHISHITPWYGLTIYNRHHGMNSKGNFDFSVYSDLALSQPHTWQVCLIGFLTSKHCIFLPGNFSKTKK